jgi:hypothetical protein
VTVHFVEIKTGRSQLSTDQRRVRDAVEAGRVEWALLRPDAAPTAAFDFSTLVAEDIAEETARTIQWDDDED